MDFLSSDSVLLESECCGIGNLNPGSLSHECKILVLCYIVISSKFIVIERFRSLEKIYSLKNNPFPFF